MTLDTGERAACLVMQTLPEGQTFAEIKFQQAVIQ